jgi:Putative adhesin
MTGLPPPTVPTANLRGALIGSDPSRGVPTGPSNGSRPDGSRPNGSRVVRALWITVGGILAVAALGWGTYNVISLLAHEEHTEQSSFAAADVDAVGIDNDNGSVTVAATDGDTIEVTADVSNGWQATEVSSRVVDGVLELGASCPPFVSIWCSVDYTIAMPADRPLTINGSGSVAVRGMTGSVDIDSDDGTIELGDIAGDMTVSNDNGRIIGRRLTAANVDAQNTNGRIELSFLDPPQTVSARTQNGRIDVVVPDTDVLYRVDLSTENGSTDNAVRTDPESDHVIDLSTENGSITLRPPG